LRGTTNTSEQTKTEPRRARRRSQCKRTARRCPPGALSATVLAEVQDLVDNGTLGATTIYRKHNLEDAGVLLGSFRAYVLQRRRRCRRGAWFQNRCERSRKRRSRAGRRLPVMRNLPAVAQEVVVLLVRHGAFGAAQIYGRLGLARHAITYEGFRAFVGRIRRSKGCNDQWSVGGPTQRRVAVLVDLILAFLYCTESSRVIEGVLAKLGRAWKDSCTELSEKGGEAES
jgi:hypothetical protein